MSSTLYKAVSAPSGDTILQCSQYKIHKLIVQDGPTGPGVCGSQFWLLGGNVVGVWVGSWSPVHSAVSLFHFLCDPIMTFETKLTMALAGCSGSCSANRWHMFSVSLWDFLATNPKILEEKDREWREYLYKSREIFEQFTSNECLA